MTWLILSVVVALALIFCFMVRRLRKQSTTAVADSIDRVFNKHVLGINHKNMDGTRRQDIINGCRTGEELILLPEPDNHCGPGIMKVCRKSGAQIGYLSVDSDGMARDLQMGWNFRAMIDDIYPFEENPQEHGILLRLEVFKSNQFHTD